MCVVCEYIPCFTMSLLQPETFQFIIRVEGTNVDGKVKIPYALTAIKGVGRRLAFLACKKAEIDPSRRAGELTKDEVNKLVEIVRNPLEYSIPEWFVNRKRDFKDNASGQALGSALDTKLRDDLERLRKIRCHRGIRHMFGLKVRGQRTKTTNRHGRTMGVKSKK